MDLKIENEWLWMFVKTVSISECRCGYPPNENGILCEACVATQMLDARKRHLTSAMHTDGEGRGIYVYDIPTDKINEINQIDLEQYRRR